MPSPKGIIHHCAHGEHCNGPDSRILSFLAMYSETCSVVSVQYYMSFVVHVKFILLIEEKEEKNTDISYIKFEEKK